MTQFDYLALAVIFVSAVAGWMRGAVREMVTIVSFLAAAFVALFSLRWSGPFAREVIDTAWLANVAAVIVVFLVSYMFLRLLGAGLTRHIQNANMLGVLDRSVGLGFGLIRALIILGAFSLLFNATTPPERIPRWISGAALYPMTTRAGEMLRSFAPKGLDMAGRLKPAFVNSVRDNTESGRYDAREQNDGSDDLVEKSR